jgi:hypothetical protein
LELSQHIKQFISTIKNTIDIYDTGNKLYYQRSTKDYCGILYLGVQTYQCLHMYNATKDPFFYNLYKKWYQYFDINEFKTIY